MSDVIGVIPARWGSVRFPGKILVSLCGKPLIQWVWERARRAKALDALLVATDDDRIAEAVRAFGGEVVMTRGDHPSGTDRIAEAVGDRPAAAVINIQGDEPLVEPGLIDRMAEGIRTRPEWDMVTAAAPLRDAGRVQNPSVVKVVCDDGGRALYFSRSPIPYEREKVGLAAGESLYWRHIGIYGYQRAFLERLVRTPPARLELAERLEQLRALALGGWIHVLQTGDAGPGVDEPGDVARAEDALRRLALEGEVE